VGQCHKNQKGEDDRAAGADVYYAQSIADEQDRDPTLLEFKSIDKEKIKQTAKKIEQIISENPKASPRAKAKLRYIQKNFPENNEKYIGSDENWDKAEKAIIQAAENKRRLPLGYTLL